MTDARTNSYPSLDRTRTHLGCLLAWYPHRDSYEGILNQRCVERRETASRIIALALSELRDELERRMYKYLYEKTIQEQNEA